MIGMDLLILLVLVGTLRGAAAVLEEWLDWRETRHAHHR